MTNLPVVRWGIVATGNISEQFVSDILKPDWPGKSARHTVQAIGSSSMGKCKKFAEAWVKHAQSPVQPALYSSYQEVYDDAQVDCVYIGTPHSLHRQNCLDAIQAGKNLLCEKPLALNAREAEQIFTAAREKGVFVMEAMWTRFYPLVKSLQTSLHNEHKLGVIHRTFCDFALDIDIASLPATSRYRDPALGAGSLLDIGVYSLTWALMTLSENVGDEADEPEVISTQTLAHGGVDVASSIVLNYTHTGRQGICTSTTNVPCQRDFAQIEGSKGYIIVHGSTPASPRSFVFYPKDGGEEERYMFEKPGWGFFWEADAVAQDIHAGRIQNTTMPWAETLRVLRIMDGVRRRSGARFPVDDW